MTTVVSSLHFQMPAGVPEWIHLTPAGTFSGADGRGPFRIEDAAAVIADSMQAGKLPVDENHAIDVPNGGPAPARGWIVAMEARGDGIWGRVEWTGTGRALLEDLAYRGISPVLLSAKADGRIKRILRAALTNDPNLTLTTLHNRSNSMDFLSRLRQALGLPADATEEAMLTSVSAHALAGSTLGKVTTALGLAADAKSDDIVAGATGKAADAGKLGAITAHFQKAGLDLAKLTPSELETHLQACGGAATETELRQTVISLQSRLDTMANDQAKDKAVAFVDAAITAGKPIKALRDHFIARHQKDAAAVETEINALVSIHGGGIVRQPKPAEGGLDAEEASVAQLMGIDPKKMAESKAELDKTAH
jgi:phage I-like protein